jgi:hypothetical protein
MSSGLEKYKNPHRSQNLSLDYPRAPLPRTLENLQSPSHLVRSLPHPRQVSGKGEENMSEKEMPPVEGERTKPYRVWRLDINDERFEMLAAYDTEEEARKHPRRLDQRTAIYHRNERLPSVPVKSIRMPRRQHPHLATGPDDQPSLLRRPR